MTRDEILAMEAGRELDALVAEKVMDWKSRGDWWVDEDGNLKRLRYWDSGTYSDPFEPSTDVAAAWEVVDKLSKDGLYIFLTNDDAKGRRFDVSFELGSFAYSATGETPALAICRAALLAVMEHEPQ